MVPRLALRPSAQMSTVSNGVHCGKKSLFMAFAPAVTTCSDKSTHSQDSNTVVVTCLAPTSPPLVSAEMR